MKGTSTVQNLYRNPGNLIVNKIISIRAFFFFLRANARHRNSLLIFLSLAFRFCFLKKRSSITTRYFVRISREYIRSVGAHLRTRKHSWLHFIQISPEGNSLSPQLVAEIEGNVEPGPGMQHKQVRSPCRNPLIDQPGNGLTPNEAVQNCGLGREFEQHEGS